MLAVLKANGMQHVAVTVFSILGHFPFSTGNLTVAAAAGLRFNAQLEEKAAKAAMAVGHAFNGAHLRCMVACALSLLHDWCHGLGAARRVWIITPLVRQPAPSTSSARTPFTCSQT